jgi:hypothetical protein
VFPLPAERVARPRLDGWYGADDQPRVPFSEDGGVEFDGEAGSWKIDDGMLLIATPGWQCEGALDSAAAFLLCSPEGRVADRVQLQLSFVPDSQ